MNITGRLLVATWGGAMLVLNFAYNCNLRANLLDPDFEAPVNAFDDILIRDVDLEAKLLIR